MKGSKQHSENKWIKKRVKEIREIENLKYLMQLKPKLIPHVKNITNEYYYIERCKPIEPKDFEPYKFRKIYLNLLIPLHKTKKEVFTEGIYKYYGAYSLKNTVNNQRYVPYIFNKFKKLIRNTLIQQPPWSLLKDKTFTTLLKHLKNMTRRLKDWKPTNGYSLLHGDLHIGNIVKRNNNFLLIDFEYLRYGAAELEVANLIISCLIWYHKKNYNSDLIQMNSKYFQLYNTLPFLDAETLKLFFIFSLSLFYFSLYLRRKQSELEILQKIIKQYLNEVLGNNHI